jgi:hypothetical protein
VASQFGSDQKPRKQKWRENPRHFFVQNSLKNGFFYSFNVELTGAARLYRAASSD